MVERILLKLNEDPRPPHPELTPENQAVIQSIIDTAVMAKKLKGPKGPSKFVLQAIEALSDSPAGLTARELLLASDSDNIVSLLSQIRKQLKRDNIYTLAKKGKGDNITYALALKSPP